VNVSEWDIKFTEQRRIAFEKAQAQLRHLVEQKQLRAAAAEAEAKLRSAEPKARTKKPRRKKPARLEDLARQMINDSYPNGTRMLSNKDLCNSVRDLLPKGTKMGDTTILRAAGRK
jgi:hypothetical protein